MSPAPYSNNRSHFGTIPLHRRCLELFALMAEEGLVALPIGSNLYAKQLGICKHYGPQGRLKCDVVCVEKVAGKAEFRRQLTPSMGKNRWWLKISIEGKMVYWHRLVAFLYCNPRNLTWDTYNQMEDGRYKYQALHTSSNECDFSVSNLLVGTKRQNTLQYRAEAKAKYRRVFRG